MKTLIIPNSKFVQQIILFSFILTVFCYCSPSTKYKQANQETLKELTDKIYSNRNEDSLMYMLKHFVSEQNDLGAMLCYKQLGLYYRENARFTEAINHHMEGLNLAIKLNDTIEIVKAYNNLGTDFRRIGYQGEASDYHYKALTYAEAYSQVDVPGTGMKNRVISLNGIGNVSLTLGYLDDAAEYFRMALLDEIKLESALGQAINYANLGAVFELKQQLDSAHIYYNYSLELNRKAKSNMGVGLCLIHIGQLYEKEKKYEEANAEYQEAYNLMRQISDKWHWLEACMSIARIHLLKNNIAEFNQYIQLAEETANLIQSPEHLASIYLLKHDYDIKQNNHQQALYHYKKHTLMHDSVQGKQRASQFMDVRVNYEQNKNTAKLQKIQAESQIKQEEKQRAVYALWAVLLVGLTISGLLYYAYIQRSRSNKVLKELEQTRTDFFTNITHEFRTPLTVIQGFNTLLQEKTDLSEKERKPYRIAIQRQCNNLLHLVNQLLDISKLKSGKERLPWKRGDIVSYLRMTAETFKLYAEEKKVNLIFYSELVSQEMDFIPFYMDKIVTNLLSNAIKYTEAGDKIEFIIAKEVRQGTLTIRIADTGEGIAKDDLKRIFELFYQSENGKNKAGTGIGLAFTQMMVEKMKGKIEVESELGKGSIFTITLPLKNKMVTTIDPLLEQPRTDILLQKYESEELPEDNENMLPESENGEKEPSLPVILLVEDNKDVNTYIKTLIGDQYNVIVARNGQDGIQLAENHIPDLVITDVMMPVKDGIQLCIEMKQNVMLNHIPVIMLTAKSSDADRIQGLRCGAEAYIKKPFQSEELFACMHNLLDGRKKLIEKYRDTLENNVQSTAKITSDANLKYLQTITDIIYAEILNPELSSTYIAEKMAVSSSQLNRKLNGITGCSTIGYILLVKLNKAKKMLQNTANSVSEVAYACGFDDPSYFSRVFKKEFGISPSQYQKLPQL